MNIYDSLEKKLLRSIVKVTNSLIEVEMINLCLGKGRSWEY